MPLEDGQVSLRGLVMGRNTKYRLNVFNPWQRQTRTSATGEAPWGDGGWSGTEWREAAVVNFGIGIMGDSEAEWQELHWQLDEAFAPIGDDTTDVTLTWRTGGFDYAMFGRPRMLNPDARMLRTGRVWATASFAAPDPSIYSAAEHSITLGLPRWGGGLTHPFRHPFVIGASVVDGAADVDQVGRHRRGAALLLRITGPVTEPRFTVVGPDGVAETLHFDLRLDDKTQTLDVHTGERIVLLNGSASRLKAAWGDWPLLRRGASTLRYQAAEYNADSRLVARWRDRW